MEETNENPNIPNYCGVHKLKSGWDGEDLPRLKTEEQLWDYLQKVYTIHFLSKAGDFL